MAANDLLKVPGSSQEVQDNTSAALSGGGIVACATRNLLTTDNPNYPLVDIELSVTFADAVGIDDGELRVYGRKMNINGAGKHGPVPAGDYPRDLLGIVVPDDVTSEQHLVIEGAVRGLYELELYFENATAKQVSAGYTVRAIPVTHRPEA